MIKAVILLQYFWKGATLVQTKTGCFALPPYMSKRDASHLFPAFTVHMTVVCVRGHAWRGLNGT